jgi:hypothetical protein
MFSNLNTKKLLLIFGVLLGLTVILVIRNNSKSTLNRNRNFQSQLTDFDTATVNRLSILPRGNSQAIDLSKQGKTWQVRIDGKEYPADNSAIRNMLASLSALRAMRIAATEKEQWNEYEVSDSMATRVTIRSGKKKLAEIYLGKFSYQQLQGTGQNMYGQPQMKMTTYLRLGESKPVYAVDGFLAMQFNRQAKDFRDRTLIRSNKEDWTAIAISSGESSYKLVKQGNNWIIGGLVPDSAKVAGYLNDIAYLNSTNFADEELIADRSPVYTLSIEGENFQTPVTLTAFSADTVNGVVISSSMNKGSFFSGNKGGLSEKVFRPKSYFFSADQDIP